ncbi:TPA: hypothetical protein ACGZPM_005392, partial [Klebsiella pneumoniae]
LKTQPATGETYPKSDLFNKAADNYSAPSRDGIDESSRKNLESLKMCPYLRGLECHLALIQHSAADMCYVQVDTVLKIRSR